MTDEERTTNECPKGKYEGNIHRWKLMDMPLWFGPDPIVVGQGNADSNESFLPHAYLAVRFVCVKCKATTWEESVFEIEGAQIWPEGQDR